MGDLLFNRGSNRRISKELQELCNSGFAVTDESLSSCLTAPVRSQKTDQRDQKTGLCILSEGFNGGSRWFPGQATHPLPKHGKKATIFCLPHEPGQNGCFLWPWALAPVHHLRELEIGVGVFYVAIQIVQVDHFRNGFGAEQKKISTNY